MRAIAIACVQQIVMLEQSCVDDYIQIEFLGRRLSHGAAPRNATAKFKFDVVKKTPQTESDSA
jgi:hypothetical protein